MNNFDKLKERIEAYLANIPKDRTADVRSLLADLLDYADDLMKNGNDGWISVDERLPSYNDEFLVYVTEHDTGYQYRAIAYFCNNQWRGSNPNGDYVTHWQPLPQPPKEQK